jgi:phenol 2-monooxygenase (NADPH)
MHDSFNLAWKLNLVLRNIALPSLLDTYENERKLIAQRLVDFDFEHARAFQAGNAEELAQNFSDNIGFISGTRADYKPNELNHPMTPSRYGHIGVLAPGVILPRAKVTRYIDANPVDIQLDIPLLSQFWVYFVVPKIHFSMPFLNEVSDFLISDESVLWRASKLAEKSYELLPVKKTEADEYLQPGRYNEFSKLFTPAILTTTEKKDIEIKDLPVLFRSTPWTFYLDDIENSFQVGLGSCMEKWFGRLDSDLIAIVNVRPDGYVGSTAQFEVGHAARAKTWFNEYYGGFLNA